LRRSGDRARAEGGGRGFRDHHGVKGLPDDGDELEAVSLPQDRGAVAGEAVREESRN